MINGSIFSKTLLVLAAWMLSNGGDEPRLPLRNQAFNFQVRFPTDVVVCDRWNGFYAWLNRITDCSAQSVSTRVRFISIRGSYNSNFETTPVQELPCAPGSRAAGLEIDFTGIELKDLRSVACAARAEDGSIYVVVSGQGGKWPGSHDNAEMQTPWKNYVATLGTDQQNLARDLHLFRSFIREITVSD